MGHENHKQNPQDKVVVAVAVAVAAAATSEIMAIVFTMSIYHHISWLVNKDFGPSSLIRGCQIEKTTRTE